MAIYITSCVNLILMRGIVLEKRISETLFNIMLHPGSVKLCPST